ncbi:MFS transporter [Rugosimonospora africana]|uniref:Major facilitator superfamily (MFS) profile domain-containing protein n=1 Tax=Rugosimonospora africana TaxID=556532 RepID=A0A8J3QYR3_9ACTN|nr:MFS transporter [Rugosimonospora africana]GIH19860.1 hypothetical protein Raf01_80320 [Rugosimonospora africana]
MIPSGYTVPAQPPVVRPLWSLAGPALGALLAAGLLTAPIGPLATAIQRDLGLSIGTVMVFVGAPYAVLAVALVAPGYLLGRLGPTATGVPALVLMLLGNAVSVFAQSTALILIGRLLAGAGAGVIVGVAFALSGQLSRWRTQARLALALALGVALLLGPVVSGVLTNVATWRWAFLAGVPVAAVALAAAAASGIAMAVLRASRPGPLPGPAMTAPFPSQPWPGGPTR